MPAKSKKLSIYPLHLQVRQTLWREILSGDFSKVDILPSEPELCERYGVSRSTLRSAVTSLEQEGYIKRIHGLGTIVNKKVCSLRMRIDLKIEFSEVITMAGFHPETKYIRSQIVPATDDLVELYEIKGAGQLLMIEKVWLADGKPAIHCIDWLPMELIQKPYREKDLEKDIFALLKKSCNLEVAYQTAKLLPRLAGESFAELFQTSPNTPLITIAGSGYSFDGKPLLYGRETYSSSFCDLTFLRTKI